jgi:TAG lipase/steryl ester hydrolase/phospholipase A2/LPA acyltransferase
VKALYEQDLLPRIVSASSVGSIIAAFICCNHYEDLLDVIAIEKYIERPLLKYKHETSWQNLSAFLRGETILDSAHLRDLVRTTIGDLTFKEVHDKFKWCLNITVTDAIKADETRLLNYLTSPNVVIWSAVSASTAIPKFFDPVELMVKTETGEILPYHPEN